MHNKAIRQNFPASPHNLNSQKAAPVLVKKIGKTTYRAVFKFSNFGIAQTFQDVEKKSPALFFAAQLQYLHNFLKRFLLAKNILWR